LPVGDSEDMESRQYKASSKDTPNQHTSVFSNLC